MKILYVEDNPTNVYLLQRVARMGDHEIVNFIDGDEALRLYDSIKPDLILMDIQLAGEKTGIDVVRVLRERGVTVPIVAVTAYAMVGDRERCLAAGCDDYLAKPLAIPRLVDILKTYSAQAKKDDATTVASEPEPIAAPEATSQPDTSTNIEAEETPHMETASQDSRNSYFADHTPPDNMPDKDPVADEEEDTITGMLDETLPINTGKVFDNTLEIEHIEITDAERHRGRIYPPESTQSSTSSEDAQANSF